MKKNTTRNVLEKEDIDLISAGISIETFQEQNAQLEKVELGPFWYRDRNFDQSHQVGTMTEEEKKNFLDGLK